MAETRYYELDGCAIVWEPGRLPHVANGPFFYAREKVMRDATPISKAEFDKLVAATEKPTT